MKYRNPIISGFHPDPSICRAGEDYYLATSSFEYFPGIPIYHSRDLVNWTHVSNAITRQDQLPFEAAKASEGIWAPTIRYDNGVFYITATFSGKGNFIIYTSDPSGEWSDPVWTEMDGIDPSMLFDNGKMYYCANDCGSRWKLYKTEGISVAEMDPVTGKVLGEIKRVWEGTGGGWLEAPHIYHIGKWYYILAAEGGTGTRHMEVAARSQSIWGPYENCPENPVLTNRNDTTKQADCCGHADLIEDSAGSWWFVHLGTRPYAQGKTPLGRETFLTPVEWRDHWLLAAKKKACIENECALNAEQSRIATREFLFQSHIWEPEWISVRGRQEKYVRRGNGHLVLSPSGTKLSDPEGIPSFVAVRQPDFECTTEIELDFTPEKDGDEAGLAVYLTPRNYYCLCKRRENGESYIVVHKHADDFWQEIYRKEAAEGRLRFRIDANKATYEFFYSICDDTYVDAGTALAKFVTTEVADRCFTGTVIGVYAQAGRETDAKAFIYSYKSYIM